MKKQLITVLILLLVTQHAAAQTGTDIVEKYLDVDRSKKVNEFSVRDAILRISPKGTSFKDVVKKLEGKVIYYHPKGNSPNICFPGDNTPIYCQFKSTKEFRGSEPDYAVDYIFNSENKVKDVVVVRSYAGRVKRYTTNPTQPAKNIVLRNNLSVGSKIKQFDSVYGEGQFDESSDVADDWPLSLEYFDKKNKEIFLCGCGYWKYVLERSAIAQE